MQIDIFMQAVSCVVALAAGLPRVRRAFDYSRATAAPRTQPVPAAAHALSALPTDLDGVWATVEHQPLHHLRHVVARQLAVGLVVVDDDLLEEFRHPGVEPLAVDEDLGELVELREEEAEDRRRAEVHL